MRYLRIKSKVVKLSIALLVVATIAFVLAYRYLPALTYPRAQSNVNKELAEIQLSKQPTFEATKNGCGTSYGEYTIEHGCSFSGEKLYRGTNNFESDIREVDQKLKALGWVRKLCYWGCANFDNLFSHG